MDDCEDISQLVIIGSPANRVGFEVFFLKKKSHGKPIPGSGFSCILLNFRWMALVARHHRLDSRGNRYV